MSEQVLYQMVKRIMDNEAFELNGHDFGEWSETVTELAGTPPEWRSQTFQALDKFHRGELTRLLASYQPEEAPPETVVEAEEEEPECPQLPSYIQADPDLATAASPWLNDYIEFCNYWSPRGYPGYHEACGIWLLSTIAARRLGFHLGYNRYTNLYIMMAGVSSKFTKSGATTLATKVLRQAELDWLRAPNRTTPQALISYMTGHVPENYESYSDDYKEIAKLKFGFAAQLGWFYEEFGTGISAMTQQSGHMAEFSGLLREFYDCPPEHKNFTKTWGKEIVERPYLALIANLTPADLRRVASRGAQIWTDGFLARFGFIVPPPDQMGRAFYPDGELTIPDDIIAPLQAWHQRLGLPVVDEVEKNEKGGFLPGPITLRVSAPPKVTYYAVEGEIKDMIREYNLALLDMLEMIPDDLESYYIRLYQKAVRVAVLLASLDGYESIAPKHWARAQLVAEEWRVSIHRIYKQIMEQSGGDYTKVDLEDRILAVIKKYGGLTSGRMRAYIKNYSTLHIERHADAMVQAGLLQATTKPWGERLIKRYDLPPSDNDLDQKVADC